MMNTQLKRIGVTILLMLAVQTIQAQTGKYLRITENLFSGLERYALIIGVDHYADTGISSFTSCRLDAAMYARHLVGKRGFRHDDDHVVFLPNPNKAKIIRTFLDILNRVENPKNTVFTIYYSGHGYNGKIVPTDARKDDVTTFLNYEWFTTQLKAKGIKKQVHIIDACHAESMVLAGTKSLSPAQNSYEQAIGTLSKESVVWLCAVGTINTADPGKNNSLFTKYLLEALKEEKADKDNNGILTAKELYQEIDKELGTVQTPKLRGDGQFPISFLRAISKVSPLQESVVQSISFSYGNNNELRFGNASSSFGLNFSSSDSKSIHAYASSDNSEIGLIPNCKFDLGSIVKSDLSATDRSSFNHTLYKEDVLVIKNQSKQYAVLRVDNIDLSAKKVKLRYLVRNMPIINSTWKRDPLKYSINGINGSATFKYALNNGSYHIGSGNFKFHINFSTCGTDCIWVNNSNNEEEMYKSKTFKTAKESELDLTNKVVSSSLRLAVDDVLVIKNIFGKYCLIRPYFINARRSGTYGEDEVVFQFKILKE